MKPQDFLKEYLRICKIYDKKTCEDCPLYTMPCEMDLAEMEPADFAKMYDAVAEWSDAHPVKTRQSEFLKLFPNARVRDGAISLCPKFYCLNFLGTDLPTCNATNCAKCMHEYWLAPIDESEDTK